MIRIAISTDDGTRDLALCAELSLIANCFDVCVFEADGLGGPAMEAAIINGTIDGVLDLCLTELIDGTHPDRLTAAGLKRVPQVIVPGGLAHCDSKTLDALGKQIAEKASAAGGPTVIVTANDTPTVLRESIANWVYPPRLLIERSETFSDDAFSEYCVATLIEFMNR